MEPSSSRESITPQNSSFWEGLFSSSNSSSTTCDSQLSYQDDESHDVEDLKLLLGLREKGPSIFNREHYRLPFYNEGPAVDHRASVSEEQQSPQTSAPTIVRHPLPGWIWQNSTHMFNQENNHLQISSVLDIAQQQQASQQNINLVSGINEQWRHEEPFRGIHASCANGGLRPCPEFQNSHASFVGNESPADDCLGENCKVYRPYVNASLHESNVTVATSETQPETQIIHEAFPHHTVGVPLHIEPSFTLGSSLPSEYSSSRPVPPAEKALPVTANIRTGEDSTSANLPKPYGAFKVVSKPSDTAWELRMARRRRMPQVAAPTQLQETSTAQSSETAPVRAVPQGHKVSQQPQLMDPAATLAPYFPTLLTTQCEPVARQPPVSRRPPLHSPSFPSPVAVLGPRNKMRTRYPREYDILLGRGNRSNRHPGNVRFRNIVRRYREFYQRSTVTEQKTAITQALVAMCKLPLLHHDTWVNPQFLSFKKESCEWEVVEDEIARQKVAHVLRTKDNAWKK